MAAKKNEETPKTEELKDGGTVSEAAVDTPTEEKETPNSSTVKPSVNDADGFCVYIGPTIQGVIQSGTVYNGTRENAGTLLASAIEKYPLIAKLIVTDKTFSGDRIKVKTPGNHLNALYKRLATGQKTT